VIEPTLIKGSPPEASFMISFQVFYVAQVAPHCSENSCQGWFWGIGELAFLDESVLIGSFVVPWWIRFFPIHFFGSSVFWQYVYDRQDNNISGEKKFPFLHVIGGWLLRWDHKSGKVGLMLCGGVVGWKRYQPLDSVSGFISIPRSI